MDEPSRPIKSVETMFRIVETLVDRDGARITELSEELGLAKSTVHQQLSTLSSLGYAIQEDGEYHAGLRFLSIGEHTRLRRDVSQLVEPMVRQLAQETKERVQFLVEEAGRAIYLHLEEGERGVRVGRHPGKLRSLHSCAGGKAIMAHMDHDTIEKIIDRRGLSQETENTITEKEALFEELDRVRQRGYATNKEESIGGLWSLGVPVVANDEVLGAFSVSGPRYRFENKWFHEELPDLLRGTANELELKIEYS